MPKNQTAGAAATTEPRMRPSDLAKNAAAAGEGGGVLQLDGRRDQWRGTISVGGKKRRDVQVVGVARISGASYDLIDVQTREVLGAMTRVNGHYDLPEIDGKTTVGCFCGDYTLFVIPRADSTAKAPTAMEAIERQAERANGAGQRAPFVERGGRGDMPF